MVILIMFDHSGLHVHHMGEEIAQTLLQMTWRQVSVLFVKQGIKGSHLRHPGTRVLHRHTQFEHTFRSGFLSNAVRSKERHQPMHPVYRASNNLQDHGHLTTSRSEVNTICEQTAQHLGELRRVDFEHKTV